VPGPDLIPLATDTVMVIRDGEVHLRGPKHDDYDRVPEDFLVILGMAHMFHEEYFRASMLVLVKERFEAGHLDGILRGGMSH
jgi:hypothetical protein